jgi:hypothetical protein
LLVDEYLCIHIFNNAPVVILERIALGFGLGQNESHSLPSSYVLLFLHVFVERKEVEEHTDLHRHIQQFVALLWYSCMEKSSFSIYGMVITTSYIEIVKVLWNYRKYIENRGKKINFFTSVFIGFCVFSYVYVYFI